VEDKEDKRLKECIYCKRILEATNENFSEEKKRNMG
jgi:hypothetical protein